MRLVTVPALLLEVLDLHDRDRIVTLLTAEYGKVRGVARGAKGKYSRFSGQLQPLSKVRISWFEKDGRDLVRLTDCELIRPAERLHSTLEGTLTASCFADQMRAFAQENEESGAVFRLLDTCLGALDEGADLDLVARYYEIWLLRLAGIFPPPWACPQCDRAFEPSEPARFDQASQALLCWSCAAGGFAVSASALELLRRSARENLAHWGEPMPSPALLHELEETSGQVRRAFLGHELKSFHVQAQTLRSAAVAVRK